MSDTSSSNKLEFKPGGFVPSGPVHVVLQEPTAFVRLDLLSSADQSPDAGVVTYDHDDET
jgi:hypothetical protein